MSETSAEAQAEQDGADDGFDFGDDDIQEGFISSPEFKTINFNDEPGDARPIPNLGPLLDRLGEQRLLLIAGKAEDKRELARRCGWEFTQLLRDENPDASPPEAQEKRPTLKAEDILLHLDELEKPTVFVLPHMDPAEINRNLAALRKAAGERHWIIIATDRPRASWYLSEETEASWIEPEEEALYSKADLRLYLASLLGEDEIEALTKAAGGAAKLDVLVKRLGLPRAVEAFARLWPQSEDSPAVVADSARAVSASVRTWFHTQLSAREQMVALSLAVFDGLEEDLAFAAIESLMEGAWRKRDSAFAFVDYGDLASLSQYFTFSRDGANVGRLRAIGDGTRSDVIAAAWRDHRRLMIAALPELTRLVQGAGHSSSLSAATADLDRQLGWLRESVAGALGEVCRLSMRTAEPHLLNLVASGAPHAHQVVAAALRRVVATGGREDVFELLERWRSSRAPQRYVQTQAQVHRFSDATSLIGSAMAVIVGQLSLEDEPDQLGTENRRMLLAYAASGDERIIARLASDALPAIVPNHPEQSTTLADELLERVGSDWVNANRLCAGLGQGFAIAGRTHGALTSEAVSRWLDEGLSGDATAVDRERIALREKRLALVAYALGGARSAGKAGDSLPRAALTDLHRLLKAEPHPFVRAAAMEGLDALMAYEFEPIKDGIEDLVEQFTPAERQAFVRRMVALHCLQRSRQEGGDAKVFLNRYLCPIWYDRAPDNTRVQQVVFQWSETARSAAVAEFAADVVTHIRRVIERDQEERREQLLKHREAEEERRRKLSEEPQPELQRHTVKLTFLQRKVAVGLATLGRAALRHTVGGLLASILRLPDTEAEDVLKRYEAEGRNDLAARARRARWISKNMLLVLGAPAALILLLVLSMLW